MIRVLIVEDEPITRRVIRRLLERENIEVLEAGNGQAALAILQQRSPDVIVSDFRMPGMTGEDLFHALPAVLQKRMILFTSTIPRPAVPREVPVLDKRTDVQKIVRTVQQVARLTA